MTPKGSGLYNWHNFCLGIKISMNSGALVILAMLGMFGLIGWATRSKDVAALLPGLWPWYFGLFGGGLVKRAYDKKQGEKAELEKLRIETPTPNAGDTA